MTTLLQAWLSLQILALLRAARRAGPVPLTIGLTGPSLLRRRITKLTRPPRPGAAWLPAALAVALATTAWASSGLVDRGSTDLGPIVAASSADLAVPDDPVVAEALDRLLANPAYLRGALARSADHATLVHGALDAYGLPSALAAYNQGARHVREAIAREGTRDPWELARRGAINEYAPTVMAAVLVLEDPSLVR